MSDTERQWVADYKGKAEVQLAQIFNLEVQPVKRSGRKAVPIAYRDNANLLTLS